MSKILVFFPDGASHAVALRQPRLHIGRHPHNTLVLPDTHVSGVHAVLQRTESGWWIDDLGSTNGTWINGKRVNTSLLLPDDVLRIGRCSLHLLPAADKADKAKTPPAQQDTDSLPGALTPPADFGATDLMRPDR